MLHKYKKYIRKIKIVLALFILILGAYISSYNNYKVTFINDNGIGYWEEANQKLSLESDLDSFIYFCINGEG